MEDYRLEQSGQEVQDILNGAAMQSDLTAETERATEAEQTLQGNIDAEATRAQDAEGTLQDNIDAEEARAKAAEKQNADDIDAIEEKIPSGASSSNKLATEEYVADAVATATATFRGTYNLVSDLHLNVTATEQQIAAALSGAISTADNNDYCFIQVPTSSETPTEIKEIDRYKFNGTAWAFEYKLNNSGFTAAQWAAINSGITSGDVAKLAALPTNAQLTTLLAGLQSDIDGEETRAKAAELALQGNIDAEEARAKAAEKQNADNIDAIEAVIPESASLENKVATKSEIDSLSAAIEAILLLIPSAATSLNKLADKAYVNSSIATATATFRGTYNLVNDLGLTTSATHDQIATALAGAILTADNNDYAFVQIPTSDAIPTEIAKTERYKFNGTAWEYEYDLNNSGFTADQWAAINSGITQALVTKLAALPTNAELTTEIGTLTSGITTINQKIPAAASQANKLVDTAAMESYIVEVLNVLTISYNVTSTDGHVTLSIEQVDGKITSVTLTTSDIASAADLNLKASQADLTALASRVTTAEGNITTLGGRMTTAESNITSLGGRVSTNETDIAALQALYNALQQSEPQVIEPTDTWPVANPSGTVIYRVIDRVNTPPQYYSDYMWNGMSFVLMATYDNAIDDEPTAGSNNLVKSGGVKDSFENLPIENYGVKVNLVPLTGGIEIGGFNDSTGEEGANPSRLRTGYIQISGRRFVKKVLGTFNCEVLCYKYENGSYTYLGYVSNYANQGEFNYKIGTTHIRLYIRDSSTETPRPSFSVSQTLLIYNLNDTIVQKKDILASIREDITIKSADIWEGVRNWEYEDSDCFSVKIPVVGVSTITINTRIQSDYTNRRTIAFNSAGQRLDYWNGQFDPRDINLPANTSYITSTMNLDYRDECYIIDKATGNYLFKYSPYFEVQTEHRFRNIRVGQWNVGEWDSEYYWDGSQATKTEHTTDELISLLKDTFTKMNADILLLNEFKEYLDSGQTVKAYDTLFKQFYPYYLRLGLAGLDMAILSKFPIYVTKQYTANGAFANYFKGYIDLGCFNKLAFGGIHLPASSAEDRLALIPLYAELFDSYKLAIIAGDMNTGNNGESAEIIQAQITPFTAKGYIPSNRGYWGAKVTYYRPEEAMDNIYAKGLNVTNYEVLEERPGSDHYPTVADISVWD